MTEQELEAKIDSLNSDKRKLTNKKADYETMNRKLNSAITSLTEAANKAASASTALNQNYVSDGVSVNHQKMANVSTRITAQINLLKQTIEKSNSQISSINNKIRNINNDLERYRQELNLVRRTTQ